MKSVTEIQVKEEPLFDQRLLHKNEQNEIFYLLAIRLTPPNT